MTSLIGNLSLAAGAFFCVLTAMLAIASAATRMPALMAGARWAFSAVVAMLLVASAALMHAMLSSDFSIEYVVKYTEQALPFGYKLAAFWAGQEGSLLLWALLIGVMGCMHLWTRRRDGAQGAAEVATLSLITAFFLVMLLVAAQPFKASAEEGLVDGRGLNPLLQDWAMIAHPPILFLGYAAYTIPFAMMVGALIAGRRDNAWVLETRRWAVAAWLFLGVGIILGSLWAYYELGWGGYWGWDPVENGSLAPWLTGTWLVHSIMVQQYRGMLKIWNAALFAITFALCIFATILTRGGFVDSVHGFGPSLTGWFFLAFFISVLVFSLGMIIARLGLLRSERTIEEVLGRETVFLMSGILVVVMTAAILLLTIFPAITDLIAHQKLTIERKTYDRLIGPMGLLLVLIMAVGPILNYGAGATAKFLRDLIFPSVGAVLTVIVMIVLRVTNFWALLTGAIAALAVLCILVDLVRSLMVRVKAGEGIVGATFRLLDGNHRRYGGQLAHLGMMMMIVGIVGSSLFGSKEDITLKAGQPATFAGQTITFEKLTDERGSNYIAKDAAIRVTNPAGRSTELHPQKRRYLKSEQANSEVGIDWNLRRDIYVTLAGWEDDGSAVGIQVVLNPLVAWIWIGGIVMTLGGIVCLLPRILPQPDLIPGDITKAWAAAPAAPAPPLPKTAPGVARTNA